MSFGPVDFVGRLAAAMSKALPKSGSGLDRVQGLPTAGLVRLLRNSGADMFKLLVVGIIAFVAGNIVSGQLMIDRDNRMKLALISDADMLKSYANSFPNSSDPDIRNASAVFEDTARLTWSAACGVRPELVRLADVDKSRPCH